MKPDVSIIIVNYKVKDLLFNCLKFIYKLKSQAKFEVIVVNNEEVETLRKDLIKNFPNVIYIKSDKNSGYGAGNNLGAKKAKGEYLFFLNPDTQLLDQSLDSLVNFIKKNKSIGIVSPLILDNKNKPFEKQGYKELTPIRAIFSFSFLRKIFSDKTIYENYSLDDWNKEPIREVQTVYGASLMISSRLFKKIKGFDEDYFLYFEENDLSKRVRGLGYKLYINSNSKIIHQVAQSTKQVKDIEKYFRLSRYIYLKKHFGLVSALITESFLRINKNFLFLGFILLASFFLRIYNLSQSMVFIGDQGWFYLSARDLILNGKIPLVGITTSHTWLHQGPLWTYILSVALFISKFNPLSGAYLTAFLGVITVFLIYKIGGDIFSYKIGVISASLYGVSPLIVSSDRIAFDPSPIPLFTLFYFYSLYKWVTGNKNYFPLIIFSLAVLYNLELATFTLFFPFAFLLVYGFIRKKKWGISIFNKNTFIISLIALVIPMLPIFIYDFYNGFKQTFIFFAWTIYKPLSFLLNHPALNLSSKSGGIFSFFITNLQKLIFQTDLSISIVIFITSLIFLFLYVKKIKFKIEDSCVLLIFILSVVLAGVIINQTPSGAYLPIAFPFIILTVGIFFNYLLSIKKIKYLFLIIFFVILIGNFYSSFKNDSGSELKDRLEAISKVIALTNNQEYNLVGIGIGSQFRTFTDNYEYLLWWKGHPPSKRNVHLKIYISEYNYKITITKKYD